MPVPAANSVQVARLELTAIVAHTLRLGRSRTSAPGGAIHVGRECNLVVLARHGVGSSRTGSRESGAAVADRRSSAKRQACEDQQAGSDSLGVAVQGLAQLALGARDRTAGNRGEMEPFRLQALLALAVQEEEGGSAKTGHRDPPIDPENVPRESDLGCTEDSHGVGTAGI